MSKKVTPGVPPALQIIHLTPSRYLELVVDPQFLEGHWREQASCVLVVSRFPGDYSALDWFPESSIEVPRKVAAICRDCPVRIECLAYAVRTKQARGIWAGKSEKTIRTIRRRLIEALEEMGIRTSRGLG